MTELESAIALIRKEISKHEMDLRRAEQRNGARDEELQRLRDKIAQKRLVIESACENERTQQEYKFAIEMYQRLLRDKLVENRNLRLHLAMLTKGDDADGEKGVDCRLL